MTDESANRISNATRRSEAEAREALATMNPSGRLVGADEVADAILFLCQPESRSITGACLTIDGGASA
jgi:NAD(P)-dependent dehydrogenase (short-subunit alcohol dehydrogenase family)